MRSLHSKVLIVFILAFLVLGGVAWMFSKPFRGPWRDQIPKVAWVNLRHHLLRVVDEVGEPPSAEKAEKLTNDLLLELVIRDGDQTLFQTDRDLPPWEEIDSAVEEEVERRQNRPQSLRARLGDFVTGRVDGRVFAVVQKQMPNGIRNYAFFLPKEQNIAIGLRAFASLAFTMAFLLFVVLVLTRWLLQPLKPLMRGVNELSNGNLDYRVSIRPRGEFRRMGDAFNDMAKALQAQLKSKDQLLMDVSHELRSPIGRIKMATEMLPPENSLRATIQGDVREMEELVTEILELYRLRDAPTKEGSAIVNPNFEELDLQILVKDVVGPLVQQKPGVEYRLEALGSHIKADRRQLKRAVRNIIENAIKFSRDQTQPVVVRVYSETVRDGQRVSNHVIEVRDHGIGMTEEQRSRVFEPFYRADSSRVRETGGFGLGLPLAQAIIQAHGGDIECVSAVDQGTTFRVRLPKV